MVLVVLEWLHMRVWVDRTPWADVVVSLGVLGVEDFKDGVCVCVCVCLQAPKAFKALRETKVREHCVVCLTPVSLVCL